MQTYANFLTAKNMNPVIKPDCGKFTEMQSSRLFNGNNMLAISFAIFLRNPGKYYRQFLYQ